MLKLDDNEEINPENISEYFISYKSKKVPHLQLIEFRGIGLDNNNDPEKIGKKALECIRNKINSNNNRNYNDFIHCIWYCITGTRFEKPEFNLLKRLSEAYNDKTMPIIVVYTQLIDKKAADDMSKYIKKKDVKVSFAKVLAKDTKFQKIKIPSGPVFSWYKFAGFLKFAFNNVTIWRLTFNATEPDLPYYVSKAVGKFLPSDVNLQKTVNDAINNINGNSADAKALDIPDQGINTEFKSTPLLSDAQLLEEDIANSIDLTNYGLTKEDSDILVHSLLGFALVIVPITLSFAINFIYYLFYCFTCCCPCCHRKEGSRPYIVSMVFFLIGIALVLLGYVFTMISFKGFNNIVTTTRSLPDYIDESVDTFIGSMDNVSTSISTTVSQSFDTIDKTLDDIVDFAKGTVIDVAGNLTEAVNYIVRKDDSDIDNNGAIFYFTKSFTKGSELYENTIKAYQGGYDPNYLEFLNTSGIPIYGYKDFFEDFRESFQAIEDNSDSLTSLADVIEDFKSIVLDFFPSIEDILDMIDSYTSNLSNITVGDQTVSELIHDFKNSSSIVEIKDLVNGTVDEYINKYWTWATVGYLFLCSLNLILVIAFVGSFWCHTCCSSCVAACAECYPCVCTVILFILGLLTTVFSAVIVFFGRNFTPTLDSAVNASIFTVIPDGVLSFPPIDLSSKTSGYVKTKLQLPSLNLTNLTLFDSAFHSDLDTGISDFLSLSQIIPIDKFGKAIGDFLPVAIREFDVENRINKYSREATDFWSTDEIPNNFADLQERYMPNMSVYGIYEMFKSYCQNLTDNFQELEDTGEQSAAHTYCEQNHINPCKVRTNTETSSDFMTQCERTADTMEPVSRVMEEKYQLGVQAKDIAMSSISGLGTSVGKKILDVSNNGVALVNLLAESLLPTFNNISASPIINAVAIFYNTFFYDIAWWATFFSMGATLIIWGFFISVILMCIRRRGMKPLEKKQADSYTDYSDSSYSGSGPAKKNIGNSKKPANKKQEMVTIDFSRNSRAANRIRPSSSSGSSSSYSGGTNNRRKLNDSRFQI